MIINLSFPRAVISYIPIRIIMEFMYDKELPTQLGKRIVLIHNAGNFSLPSITPIICSSNNEAMFIYNSIRSYFINP
jgi:hypothetical protein